MARIDGTSGSDSLGGTSAGDVIQGYNGNDSLYGGAGNDVIYGGNGADRLFGGTGSDTLYGGAGADKMYGGDGADVLYALGGDDIWGGAGGDGFVFTSLAGDGGAIQARIHDFSRSQGDYIRLSGIDANPDQAGNQAFRFLGYDANGGPSDDGADRAGVSYLHTTVNGEPVTVVNVRSVADAGYNDPGHHMQFWIDSTINLTAGDFIL